MATRYFLIRYKQIRHLERHIAVRGDDVPGTVARDVAAGGAGHTRGCASCAYHTAPDEGVVLEMIEDPDFVEQY
jgi:hypothetical protein